jgi:hypothetical protein
MPLQQGTSGVLLRRNQTTGTDGETITTPIPGGGPATLQIFLATDNTDPTTYDLAYDNVTDLDGNPLPPIAGAPVTGPQADAAGSLACILGPAAAFTLTGTGDSFTLDAYVLVTPLQVFA